MVWCKFGIFRQIVWDDSSLKIVTQMVDILLTNATPHYILWLKSE